ncbi:MAG: hypothetical protein ACM4D3_03965 [Candidatus Sericytochromatia bacterium]
MPTARDGGSPWAGMSGAALFASLRLADVGRREQALARIEEAVRVYRALAERHPPRLRRRLARGLAVAGSLAVGVIVPVKRPAGARSEQRRGRVRRPAACWGYGRSEVPHAFVP